MKKIGLFYFLAIFFVSLSSIAKDKIISGKVTSSLDGSAVAGVSIYIKGAKTSILTDANGIYKLAVPANGQLVFEGSDFKKKEIDVSNRVIVDVQLELTRKARKKANR